MVRSRGRLPGPGRVRHRNRKARTRLTPFRRGLVFGALAVVLAAAALIGFGPARHAIAQGATEFTIFPVDVGLSTADLKQTVVSIIRWALGILGLVAVSFIIYGGFLWMTARGDEQRILKAKKVITSAVIGLIIVLLAWAIVTFVVKAITDATRGSTGGGGPSGPPGTLTRDFEIRSITTACGNPPSPTNPSGTYRDDVFKCSGVNINFNNRVASNSVEPAVNAHTLTIEECQPPADPSDPPCQNLVAPQTDPAIMNQTYEPSRRPTDTKAEWVAPQIGSGEGKSVTFYHSHQLFKPDTWYLIKIPKSIHDSTSPTHTIRRCRQSASSVTPLDGCVDKGTYFEWTFRVGVNNDSTPPTVTGTYPDSRYLADSTPPAPEYHPDRNVNRWATLTVDLSEAIDPASIDMGQANPADNTVVITEFTAPPNSSDGTGGSLPGPPLPAANFVVAPSADNRRLEIQPVAPFLFKEYTWYQITVKNLRDLCRNRMADYTFVFETNNVTPGIADVYPQNNYPFACPDTPIRIRYTVSMYDPIHGDCLVDPSGGDPNGGYVKEGLLDGPDGGRTFQVVLQDHYPGGGANPNNFCKRYSWEPTTGLLSTNRQYKAGVNSRFLLNDAGDTLNFGDLANAPRAGLVSDPLAIDWHFDVKPPGECVNGPYIDSLDPDSGPRGQCFSIIGGNFGGIQGTSTVKFGVLDPLPPLSGGWSDRNIVMEAPDNALTPAPPSPADPPNNYDATVTVVHPPPFGALTSNPATFHMNGEPTADGPCLASIRPDAGPEMTRVDLTGKRFGPPGLPTNKVLFAGSGDPPDTAGDKVIPYSSWSPTFIDNALIVRNSVTGLMQVKRGTQVSNGIQFNVIPPVPGVPSVANHWPSCASEICTNAEIGASFDTDMNLASINVSTVELRECTNDTCAALVPGNLATAVTPNGAPANDFSISGHAALQASKSYRVILHGTASGIMSSINQPLNPAQLDYDSDSTPGDDSYSWFFKVRTSPTACALDRAELLPSPSITLRAGGPDYDFQSFAYSGPDSCSPGGQRLTATAYDWQWNATPGTAVTVTNRDTTPADGNNDPVQPVTPVSATPGDTVRATEPASGEFAETTVIVNPDPTFCRTSADCASLRIGSLTRSCASSTCVNSRCTPLVTDVLPLAAPVDAWTTIEGCWFGTYGPNSKVVFEGDPAVAGDERDAGLLPAQCGPPDATWKNHEIVRAVPPGVVDGPMSVIRDDGESDSSANTSPPSEVPVLAHFTQLPGPPGPQLCVLQPPSGRGGDSDRLIGANFDPETDGRSPGDKVTYATNKDVLGYGPWAPTTLDVTVPVDAETGLVTVTKSTGVSNPLLYTIASGPRCTVPCSTDAECAVGNGCSNTGCCAPQPTVLAGSNQPQSPPDACRNTAITLSFTGAQVEPSTAPGNVKLIEIGVGEVPGVTVAASRTGLRIIPPSLLTANRIYEVQIRNGVRSTAGVRLGGLNADLDPPLGVNDAFTWQFRTSNEICQLDRLVISPPGYTFNRIVPPENAHDFTAHAYARNGVEIFSAGIYQWDWEWTVDSSAVASVPAVSTADIVTVTARTDGSTRLNLTAKAKTPAVGFTGSKTAFADIRVLVCDNPWGNTGPGLVDSATGTYHDSGGFITACDFGGDCSQEYNFSTTYCRGQNGSALLPDFREVHVRGGSAGSDRLKEFLFKEPGADKTDGIGLLVFANNGGLSPVDWLERIRPGESAGGQSFVLDNYPAYRLGSTVYVAATRLDSFASSCVDVANGGAFETPADLTFWNRGAGRDPALDSDHAPGGTNSVTMNARNETAIRQWYLTQNIGTPSTTSHRYHVKGWVKAKKWANVPGLPAGRDRAGLISQCNPLGACNSSDPTSTYDLYGAAPGIISPTNGRPLDTWFPIDFTVTKPSPLINAGLTLNCFAEPGWQVWCDNIEVKEETTACASGTLRQNMYLLSYNQNASGQTKQVFDQLLANWVLNYNPSLSPQDRAQIARDTRRLTDLQSIKGKIDTFVSKGGTLPDLTGGTFTPNLSTSKWNSWQATLGNAIGSSLPVDPLNDFDPACTASGPYQPEPSTCWSQPNKQFQCPMNSHIYAYRWQSPLSYQLGANLEYTGPGSGPLRSSTPIDLCDTAATQRPSICQCFTHVIP